MSFKNAVYSRYDSVVYVTGLKSSTVALRDVTKAHSLTKARQYPTA